MKSTRFLKCNITRKERVALKDLEKGDTITIFPGDKVSAMVVMDSAKYERKVRNMLEDERIYAKLSTCRSHFWVEEETVIRPR